MRFLFAIAIFFVQSLPAQNYSLSGKIVDLTTREPVSNLPVRIFQVYDPADISRSIMTIPDDQENFSDSNWVNFKRKRIDSTNSDGAGIFYFDCLQPGAYSVSCLIERIERQGKFVGYRTDRRYVLIDGKNDVVELTPEIYCQYDKYKNQDSCPVCLQKQGCLKVVYGLPVFEPGDPYKLAAERGILLMGYCEIPYCHPRLYCTRCCHFF